MELFTEYTDPTRWSSFFGFFVFNGILTFTGYAKAIPEKEE